MDVHLKIDRFLRRTGMPPSKFGRLAVNDPRLVKDLRGGRELGHAICTRIESFIAGWR